MATSTFHGEAASPGDAIGRLWRAPTPDVAGAPSIDEHERPAQHEVALRALRSAAEDLERLAATLPPAEALILEANIMMASDPTLTSAVERYVLADGLPAASALVAAAGDQADLLASIDDATLAARADDLRSLGRRAAAVALSGTGAAPAVPSDAIVVAEDLGPGDVPEIAARATGIALVRGGATTHAAIVARSLGVPMVCGVGPELLAATSGLPALLDGSHGVLTVDPEEQAMAAVRGRIEALRTARDRDRANRDRPSETIDGHPVSVLANVASAAEVGVALDYGATGVGLVRTELAFLESARWPTAAEHEASLRPLLDPLGARRAVVRVLDLGGDKSPPFLAPGPDRGLRVLMAHRPQFEAQIEALLRLAQHHELRVLLPLVEDPPQLLAARRLIDEVAARVGLPTLPAVGAMVETPPAADAAHELAVHSAFMSIGTNDLAAATFAEDRFTERVTPAHHPKLLRHIASTVAGAHASGVPVEVCGEAASGAIMVPLLVGLGVDELSVGAARVGEVRRWVRGLDHAASRELAARSLLARSAEDVAALVAEAGLAPPADAERPVPADVRPT